MMTYSYPITLLIVCPLIFLAGFIDSIAGGGGLISLPAFIFAGLPLHTAYGTNKCSMCLGTAVAAANYFRNGCVNVPAALLGAAGALLGSFLGTRLALSLSPRVLQICLMILLPAATIIVLTNRNMGDSLPGRELSKTRTALLALLIGLAVGGYDGFFGPGAGLFYTLALTALVHLELVKAAGTARVINFASNFSSALTWFIGGKILLAVALPCMVFAMAGNYLGSRLAIKNGKKIIRPVIAVVATLLFIRLLTDLTGV